MIDWGKKYNENYWKSLIQCLLKSTEEIPTRPTDEGGIKFLDLSPNLHHAPCLNKDINEDSKPHGEQDETSRPVLTEKDETSRITQTRRQDISLQIPGSYILQLPRQLDIKSHTAAATKAFGALTKFLVQPACWTPTSNISSSEPFK